MFTPRTALLSTLKIDVKGRNVHTSVSREHAQTQTLTASKCIVYHLRNGHQRTLPRAALSLTTLCFITVDVLQLVLLGGIFAASIWQHAHAYRWHTDNTALHNGDYDKKKHLPEDLSYSATEILTSNFHCGFVWYEVMTHLSQYAFSLIQSNPLHSTFHILQQCPDISSNAQLLYSRSHIALHSVLSHLTRIVLQDLVVHA